MKKLFACLLALILIVTMLPISAMAVAAPTIVVDTKTAARGRNVDVNIALQNNPGIISMKLSIEYDTDALELVARKNGDAFFPLNYSQSLDAMPYIANWVDSLNPDNEANGTFLTLTFRVKDDAEEGEYPITVSYNPDDVYNSAWTNVDFKIVGGSVNVVNCAHENVEHYDAKDANCLETGHSAYDFCVDCGTIISEGYEEYPLTGHTLEHHEAKEPTHFAIGNKEYWDCIICKKHFTDADAKNEVDRSEVIIDAIPHVYDDIYDLDCECGFVRTLTAIQITEQPTKKVYFVGQNVCEAGMVVTATYDDGTSGAVEGYKLSKPDTSTDGQKKVTVTYKNLTADFDITVLPADTAAFVVSDASAKEGEEFDVVISVKNNPGFVSAKLLVEYDTDSLELVGKKAGDAFTGMAFSKELSDYPYYINWVDSINPDNTTNGDFVVLTFKVKEGAKVGKSLIAVSYNPEDIYNLAYENVDFAVIYGAVEVTDYVLGDLNDDGPINNKDLGLLMQYLNNWKVDINIDAADVNGDGAVNNKDYGLLMQYLNNWDVDFGKKK